MLASILAVAFVFLINRNSLDFRIALQASAATLITLGFLHSFRVPWLLAQRVTAKEGPLSFWWGILGLGYFVLFTFCIIYTAAWFYTMQPHVELVREPDQRDVRIMQLQEQLSAMSTAESPTSLRRRTMKAADEVSDFLRSRYESHPAYAYPNSSDPNPSDERKAAIQKCQKYDQETTDEYMRKYKDRLVGLVSEYRAKGVPVGFLEQSFSQHVPVWGIPGSMWEDNPQNDLKQFRELAYHVDAKDQMISPNF